MKLPTAILFDLDETIISFVGRRDLLVSLLRQSVAALSVPDLGGLATEIEAAFVEFWSDEDRGREWRFKLAEARALIIESVLCKYRGSCSSLSSEFSVEFAHCFTEERERRADCFPGAVEAIDELRTRGVRLALVTNGGGQGQRAKIRRFNLEHRFEHIQIEGEVGFGKPVEKAYLHALEVLEVCAEETWMVGDNLQWEVAAPQRVGIYSIWHDHRREGLPLGCGVVPDRIVHALPELLTCA